MSDTGWSVIAIIILSVAFCGEPDIQDSVIDYLQCEQQQLKEDND